MENLSSHLSLVVALLCCHFVADFILQDRDMARRKSESIRVLFRHVMIHWAVFSVVMFWCVPFYATVIISMVNAILHALIDWNVWRLYKFSVFRRNRELSHAFEPDTLIEKWEYWNDHWFYVTIGFDQFLHQASIIFALWLALS